MSRPQHILAVHSKLIDVSLELKQGLNQLSLEEFIAAASSSLIIGERDALEVDEAFRQLLPYVVLTRAGADGKSQFFTYQRGKGIGEGRLLGKVSIGLGGHIDLMDIVHEKSVIDLTRTIGNAMGRELQEEVVFTNPTAGEDSEVNIFSIGTLVDNTDTVGRVHLGLVMNAQIGEDVGVACAEPELTTLGFYSAEDLLKSGLPLENWTRIIAEFYVANGL